MTCHMGEFTRAFLWSACDQCGTTVEIQYFKAQESGPSKMEATDMREDWNEHHKVCDTAKGVKAPEFTHEWVYFLAEV